MIASTQTNHPLSGSGKNVAKTLTPVELATAKLKSAGLRITQPRLAILHDIDDAAFKKAVGAIESASGKAPRTEKDFRRLLDDKSIDAIAIATPDHWHALLTVLGCQAGKDVYVEKPASHNLVEGRRMVQAARKYDRVVQLGTQRRSSSYVKDAVERIRSDLPATAEAPIVARIDVEGQAILTYAVTAPAMTPEELSWFVDDTVIRKLQGLKGVARVDRNGGVTREIKVEIDPDRLNALGATAGDVNRALRSVNVDLTGGSAKMEGAIELAEEVFHVPVRLGVPQAVNGLSDVVRNPIFSTGVGLLQYARDNHLPANGRGRRPSLNPKSAFDRMKSWFQGNL